MVTWLPLGVPVAVALILLIFFRHRTLWWEFLIPFAVSLILILIFKFTVETSLTRDTEYWGGWLVKAQYFEDWNEYIHRTCTEQYACGRDSNGNTIYCTRSYDCSYVQYHSEHWRVVDSNGIKISISQAHYQRLAKKFGTGEKFVDLHRNYHSDDGDLYEVFWDGSDETLESATTVHHYENRVQASKSTFNFYKVDPEVYGLYEYPKVSDRYFLPSILGSGGQTQKDAEVKFQRLNAKLGKDKQVRVFILIFMSQPLEAGFDQENYWIGGNKNEFILTIGVDSTYAVKWCHPISWTESELLKVEARKYVVSQETLDLVALADWLYPKIESDFIRMSFARFSYLSVEPPMWTIILTFAITAVINLVISLWIVLNEFRERKGMRHR